MLTSALLLSLFQPLPFTIFAFFLILLVKWSFSTESSTKTRPPSPPKLPIFGNLLQLGLQPHITLKNLTHLHGPIMLLHFGSKPVLVVSTADTARDIMKTNDIVFSNRPKFRLLKKLHYNCKDMATAPYGEYWRQMKSICVLHLLSSKRVQSLHSIREEETNLMITKIKQCISSSNCSVNLSESFLRLTNDIVCRAALGRKYDAKEGDGGRFKTLLEELLELLGVFSIGDYIPWLAWVDRINGLDDRAEKVGKEVDDFLNRVVQDHIHKIQNNGCVNDFEEKDFVDVLLRIQRENLSSLPLDTISIKGLILDMFVAGTDTTYTLLEWAMSELIRHPMVMKKLQNEIRGIVGTKTHIMEDHLENMHYMKAVIKETLRLHPPLPLLLPREASQDIRLKSYHIPSGTQVIINAYAIGRDPEFWEEPEEFKPDRFLINGAIDLKGHDFQLIPFGAGRRGCPGLQFATAVYELALAKLMHEFDWDLGGEARGEDLDMTESPGLTLHRKFPLLAMATPYSC